jgi:antitoxin MazE6
MKTAISMPDETFVEVDRHAADLGVSRSEFLTRAAQRYMSELDISHVIERVNAVVDAAGADDASADAVAAGHAILAAQDDEW